jgi:hypothetical protein
VSVDEEFNPGDVGVSVGVVVGEDLVPGVPRADHVAVDLEKRFEPLGDVEGLLLLLETVLSTS